MKRNAEMLVSGLAGIALSLSACGDTTDTARHDGGFLAGPIDAKAAVCNSLEMDARTKFSNHMTSLKRTTTLSCQVDSDCALVSLPAISCVVSCGQLLWTVDVPALTAATANLCDSYFAAGCPQKNEPCQGGYAICEQGGCNVGARRAPMDGGADGGAVDASLAVDASVESDAPTCDQLATTAQAQAASYIEGNYSLSCQVDSDCSFLQARSLSCFAVCGNFVVRAADVSPLTSATTGFCEPYFAAGCPERTPPCPYSRPVCDRGTCAKGPLPTTTDAAVDAGATADGSRG